MHFPRSLFCLWLLTAASHAQATRPCDELFARSALRITLPANTRCSLSHPWIIDKDGTQISGAGDSSVIELTSVDAGFRVLNAKNVTFKDARIESAVVDPKKVDSIFANPLSAGLTIERVWFYGGGAHISLNGTPNFRITATRHTGPRTNGNVIYCYRCQHGTIERPVIEGYRVPAGGPYRAIDILESEAVNIRDAEIRDIDARGAPNFAGIEYVDSKNATVTGGHISGLINGDGIFLGRSSGINITGARVENNSGDPAPLAGGGTGSGIDVFGSGNIEIRNCTLRQNGHSPTLGSRHHGFEIYQSEDVRIFDSTAEASGKNGVVIYGSRRISLNNVSVSGSQESGLFAFKAQGKADVDGTNVVLTEGGSFGKNWSAGTAITINRREQHIANVRDNTHLQLQASPGTQKNVTWSVESSFTVSGGRFHDNGVGRDTKMHDGISVANATVATITGVDTRSRSGGTQRNGVKVYGNAAQVTER